MTAKSSPISLGGWISDSVINARRGEPARVRIRILEAVEREVFAQAIHPAQVKHAKARKPTAFGLRCVDENRSAE